MPWKDGSKLKQREELVRAMMRRDVNVSALCRDAGVSRETGYKFLRRFEQQGRRGLRDRPKTKPSSEWARRWRRRLLRLRRSKPTWGARKLRWWLRRRYHRQRLPSERTLERWLRAAGLIRRRTHKRAGCGWATSARATRRCHDVWTVDYKGWFRTATGQRVEPLTVCDLHSRYLLAIEPIGTGEAATRRVFRRLFAQHGLPRAIRSDRGAPFCGTGPHGLTRLSLWWHRLGVRVEFVQRRRGLHNNAHEQMHGVLQREVGEKPARTMRAQRAALRAWQRRYNTQRPHEALGMRTPASCHRRTRRRAAPLQPPRYPAHYLVRQVKNKGEILLHGRRYGIGRAFATLPVGLRWRQDTLYEVYFGRLALGLLDLQADRYIRTASMA